MYQMWSKVATEVYHGIRSPLHKITRQAVPGIMFISEGPACIMDLFDMFDRMCVSNFINKLEREEAGKWKRSVAL
jgi:hypothetical protein